MNHILVINLPFQSRTFRQIYRLALPLHAPETLSSLGESKISLFNAHLEFVQRMTQLWSHNPISNVHHLYNNRRISREPIHLHVHCSGCGHSHNKGMWKVK